MYGVLMCPQPHTTLSGTCSVQNGTRSQFGVSGQGRIFIKKNIKCFAFLAESKCAEAKTIPNRYYVSTILVIVS